jgi:gp49
MKSIEEIKSSLRTYIGTKQIKAFPMSWGDYCKLRGFEIGDKNPNTIGYIVEYPLTEDSIPNVEGFDGYVSWSPVKAFEEAYMVAEHETHLIRIEIDRTRKEIERLEKILEVESKRFSVLDTKGQLIGIKIQILKSYLLTLKAEFFKYSSVNL